MKLMLEDPANVRDVLGLLDVAWLDEIDFSRLEQVKTTFIPGLLSKEDIIEIAQWLDGAEAYFLQQFKSKPPLVSPSLETTIPYRLEYLRETLKEIQPYFKRCALRGV